MAYTFKIFKGTAEEDKIHVDRTVGGLLRI